MDFSTGNIQRTVTTNGVDGAWMTRRTEDFGPCIESVKKLREASEGKIHHRTSQMLGHIYRMPNSLAELLYAHGIDAYQPSKEDQNFIHDWLKHNFPCFLIFPTKNMKHVGYENAVPTKPIILR